MTCVVIGITVATSIDSGNVIVVAATVTADINVDIAADGDDVVIEVGVEGAVCFLNMPSALTMALQVSYSRPQDKVDHTTSTLLQLTLSTKSICSLTNSLATSKDSKAASPQQQLVLSISLWLVNSVNDVFKYLLKTYIINYQTVDTKPGTSPAQPTHCNTCHHNATDAKAL